MKKLGTLLLTLSLFAMTIGCGGPAETPATPDGGAGPAAPSVDDGGDAATEDSAGA